MRALRMLARRAIEGYKRLLKKEKSEESKIEKILKQEVGNVSLIFVNNQRSVEESSKKEEREEKKLEEVKVEEGIEIPKFSPLKVKIGSIEEEAEEEKITLVYPLIPRKPRRNEPVFAYAKIYYDEKLNKYVYQVVEPPLTKFVRTILFKLKDEIEQKINIDFTRLKKQEAKEYIKNLALETLQNLNIKLDPVERDIVLYYIDRDFTGLGKIEPLMHDPDIEDISCDGVDIPLFVFHRNPKLGSMITNIKFETSEELDSFIIRLAQLCGKSISVANPLLDGALPDGSRVQATLATDIARKGSNFTIRKFTEEPLTPAHLLNWGTVDIKTLAYLWMVVDYGGSVLISGGTATGKTTFLNVLSLFIRPEYKIVSIEDTAELRLPHPHWVPHVARTPISTTNSVKEVDMFTLLKESLRQRPDYIIVGEVRGKEAYVLFQQMATGHAAMATIHADDLDKLIDRLTTPPIALPASLIQNLDTIVFLTRVKYRNKIVRKVKQIVEIVGFDKEKNAPKVNEVFRWDTKTDSFLVVNKSYVLKKIAEKFGFKEQQVKDELERRMLVLEWIKERNLTDFRDVAALINMYYNYPEKVIASISGEI